MVEKGRKSSLSQQTHQASTQTDCRNDKRRETALDPAAGGYSVFMACQELKIDFVGGDISFGEK